MLRQPVRAMSLASRGNPLCVAKGVRRLATGVALCVVLCALAPTVQAAQPTPIAQSTGAQTGGDCFLGICDPATWLQDAVGRILTTVLGGLIGGMGSIPACAAGNRCRWGTRRSRRPVVSGRWPP